MKKTLGKKLELGMKLVPIPLSLLLAGTMAVTVQAEEVSSETEGNQVQNNQATPPVNQELPNDGTIKNTPAEEASGLTISEEGEKGAAQVTPEIKQLAQEFYDYHTKGERDEITKAATMTSVMPEIQSVEQIEEAAKKYDHAYAIRKMDGVFKYIDLKQVKDLNLVRDEHFQEVPSGEVYYGQSLIQNNTALFFLNKWEAIFNPNPSPEEVAKIPKAIIPRSELDLTVEETFPTKRFLQMKVWEHSGLTFEEAFSRKYLPESDNRVLSMEEIKQIILTNPNLFQIQASSEEFSYYMNPFFQKLLISGKEAGDEYTYWKGKNYSLVDSRDNFATNHIYFDSFDYNTLYPIGNQFWGFYRGLNNGAIDDVADNILRKYNLYEKPFVHIDWLGKNPSLERPWFGKDNIKTFHYKLYLMKPNDKTRYYFDRDYTIDIAGVPNIAETPDGGFKFIEDTIPGGGQTTGGYEPDQGELDKLFRTVKAEGFVFKVSDVKKVGEGETEPGKVLVRYQDEQGHAIANPITDEQPGKTRYTVSPKPLISYNNKLYTYKSRLTAYDAESGEYEAGRTKEIVYEYELSQHQLPNDAPSEDKPVLEMTRFVDESGQELSDPERGLVASKTIAGYDYQSSSDEYSIRTHVYRASVHEVPSDSPSEDKLVMEMTRFVDETGQELSSPEQGLVASKRISGYDFQSSTDEDGIRTHLYRAIVHEVPTDAPSEERPVLEMTRFVDESGEELSAPERGLVASKSIANYDYQSSSDEDGIRTHVYRASVHEVPTDALSEDLPVLEMTRFVDENGQELSDPERGLVASKSIAGYDYQSSSDEDGIRTHVYRTSVHEVPTDAPVEDKPSIEITRFVDVEGRPLAAEEFGLLDAKDFEKYGFVSVTDANGVRTYVYAPKTKTQISLVAETSEQKSPVRVENSETTPVLSRVSKHQLPNTGNKNSSFLGAAIISLLASFGLLHYKKERRKK
ncbi:MucBP domain-containing protein [Streptococcus sanguinis]|uniref:LPXTG-motif cell wall anchor domain protein n=1 Tax=Streptococcus sanguinis SK405 TaxID=888817 RepID=A0ABC9PDJ7_STRSA|nr:MucBP domain-containing protein [Streptococcus sanguinis]EGC24976.1 LPXTG-motif cell wall anchor domain protein [Streptococcus sanguinis SK405]